MADDSVTTAVVHDQNPAAAVVDTATDEMKLIEKAVEELPAVGVKDLIAQEVCVRCIFRLFNIQEGIYASVSPATLYSIIEKATEVESMATKSSGERSSICSVCLGALQFSYFDERVILAEKDHAEDFAMAIAQSVKEKRYEVASFSLEVSLPTLIAENEEVIVSYMKKTYASEVWFREKFSSPRVSVKDALKLSVTHPLEKLLGVKSGVSDFRIRLTYERVGGSATAAENRADSNQSNKRLKSGNGLIKCTNVTMRSGGLSDVNCQLRKVVVPCQMTLLCSRAPIFIGGRYLKGICLVGVFCCAYRPDCLVPPPPCLHPLPLLPPLLLHRVHVEAFQGDKNLAEPVALMDVAPVAPPTLFAIDCR